MSEMRLDGRVAIVTGAGRGLGRAYAEHLAARGAKVVVNNRIRPGLEHEPPVAEEAVRAIVDAGGEAIANTSSIDTKEGAASITETALEAFGRIDIVVNNAGIIRWAGPPEVDADNLQQHLAVHVGGSFNTTRAAWPHLAEQGYGRIVMTTSSGLFGLPKNTSYAAAKGAVVGLTRSLAVAGRKRGILVNALAPAAATRLGGGDEERLAPELVAPMAAYLAHESCTVTGEIYTAGAGRFARVFLASTPGYVDPQPTPESVAEHWAAINDETGYAVPADLMEWSAGFLAHVPPA